MTAVQEQQNCLMQFEVEVLLESVLVWEQREVGHSQLEVLLESVLVWEQQEVEHSQLEVLLESVLVWEQQEVSIWRNLKRGPLVLLFHGLQYHSDRIVLVCESLNNEPSLSLPSAKSCMQSIQR